jgi:monoamine oxidase
VAPLPSTKLGHRVRFGAPVKRIRVSSQGCSVVTETGERFESDAVVSAIPVGPLRNLHVEGVSEERMGSLDRQRHALAAKVVFTYADSFWHENGQNGDAYFETAVIGGTWVQREGIMSTLVPPERLAAFLTTSQAQLEAELTEEMVEAFGEEARDTEAVFFRRWGVDPFTLGYITGWRPGDVMSVGPLHGTHEPPFYVCGSDQCVCGYMEGAVRTGRAAAAAALGTYAR